MTPISLRALWKGLRGRSLVFSVVFAMAVMGSSFAGLLRMPLRTIGFWAPLVFILPIVATALLAKREAKLKLEPEFKRICSYSLIFGSIFLVLAVWKYEDWLKASYADSVVKGPLFKEQAPDLPRGPRGKR